MVEQDVLASPSGEKGAPAPEVSEKVLRAFLEATPGASLALDRSHRLVLVNEAMAKRFGLTPGEMVGRHSAEFLPPDVLERRLRRVDEVFLSGRALTDEDVRGGRQLVNRLQPVTDDGGCVRYVVLHSVDVTDAKGVEAELRAQLAFREALATCLGSGLAAVDTEGRQVFVNPAFCQMVGWTEKELLGLTPPFPYWPPEERDAIAAVYQDAGSGEGLAGGREVRLCRKDGARLTVHLTTAPLVVEGRPIGWLASVVDITPRLRAEEALRKSETRLRLALAAARAGIWVWGPAPGTAFWSEASYRIHGLEPASDRPPFELFLTSLHPEDRERAAGLQQQLVKEPSSLDITYRVVLPDGGIRWVRDIGEPEPGPDGRFTAYIGIKLDVTEAKEAEEALRRSELKTRAILSTALSPFLLFDVSGRVLEVNDATCRMLALPREEVLGKRIADFVVDAPPGRIEARIAATLAEGGVRFGTRVRTAGGRVLDVEVSVNHLEAEGGRLVCFLHDVTEAKAAVAALARERSALAERVAERTAELSKANEELAQAARLKDEFLASTSHELRTPLTAILGLSDLLLGGGRGPLTEPQARAVGMVHESGRHLLALITDILDVSKIEAGRLDLVLAWVDLRTVCEAALSLVTPPAVQKRHVLSLEAPPVRTLFRADERRLKQVLVNLLSNAVKFTPPGGSIGIEARVDEARGEVRIEVRDTGPGISLEARSRLFRPFVQLDARLAREHGGTGLGLVLVDRLVALHGGRVELESAPGCGSRFTVVVPWVRHDLAQPAPRGQDDPPGASWPGTRAGPDSAGTLVLLVEDNDTQRSLFGEALRAHGFRVETARNGAEALEKAERIEPDVVVMDVQMPGMDGLEATRRLRATPSLRSTPVLALTALVMPGDRERCREAGVDEYLGKPISLEALAMAVERLRRRRGR